MATSGQFSWPPMGSLPWPPTGGVTKIVVAHRLATIMHADCIFLMRDGEVVGSGSFEELARRIPDFARQAELAGLT